MPRFFMTNTHARYALDILKTASRTSILDTARVTAATSMFFSGCWLYDKISRKNVFSKPAELNDESQSQSQSRSCHNS